MNVKAPPILGQQWFNAELPPWEELLGHVVVLVFCGIGDEASLARIAQVQSLVAEHPNIVCAGIHTPRIPYEDETANVASVLAQHNITIPILHDPDYRTWKRYNPEGWPTTVVIDDHLDVVGAQAGVDYFDTLAEAVLRAEAVARQRQTNPVQPIKYLEVDSAESPADDSLAFPSCVRMVSEDEIVFVDSSNNRLVFAKLNSDRTCGKVSSIVHGFNGPATVAVPINPWRRNQIFVSEPATGSILRYDRKTRECVVLVNQLLRPTGLTIDHDDSLVVADSASEQILRITDPHADDEIQLGIIGGNGTSGSEDGTSATASLAQPIALARTEVGLVFCDAAANSLRLLTDSGKITTIVGEEFEWGHVDGPAHQARLQRPSDVAILSDGSVLVADTGNKRLRRLSKRRVANVGPEDLQRVSSICVMPSGHVIIAETGNNRLLIMNSSFKSTTILQIDGLENAPSTSIIPTSGSNVNDGGSAQQHNETQDQASAAQPLDGTVGQQLSINYPAPASGPWNISIHAEPLSLLARPVSVLRNSSAGTVRVTLGEPGLGHLVIRSTLERDSTVTAAERRKLVVKAETGEAP